MRDVIIGTLSGVSAVIIFGLLSPKAQVVPAPVVRELPATHYRPEEDRGLRFMPTTQPDPARQKLKKVLDKVMLKDVRLDKALAYLVDVTGANISVNWRTLEATGIYAYRPVTVELQHATGRDVLLAALDDASGHSVSLSYRIVDGVVKISTAEDFARYTTTRFYNVRDLLDESCARSRRLAKSGEDGINEAEAIDELVKIIEENVDPTSWRDAGGSIGGVRGFDGILIVTQSVENHEYLMEFLAALRRK